ELDGRELGLGGRDEARGDAADGGGRRRLSAGRSAAGEDRGGGDGADHGGPSDAPTHGSGEPPVVDHGTTGSPVRAAWSCLEHGGCTLSPAPRRRCDGGDDAPRPAPRTQGSGGSDRTGDGKAAAR